MITVLIKTFTKIYLEDGFAVLKIANDFSQFNNWHGHMVDALQTSRIRIFAIISVLLLTGCGGDSGKGNQASGSNGGETVNRSATLSWNAPATRQNGDSIKMGELSGYVISYGQNPDDLTRTVRIPEAATMQHTITDLPEGTWFFSIQAEDLNGLISPPSTPVSKTI